MPVVGIPQALWYYTFYPFWESFFRALGVQVVLSAATTQAILDAGMRESVNDACVPIKVYHGHVAALRGKVDLIFVPRLINVGSGATFCPKFLGLPEMVRFSMTDLPEILSPWVDMSRGWLALYRVCREVGRRFTRSDRRIVRAFRHARKNQKDFTDRLENGIRPGVALGSPNQGRTLPRTPDIEMAVLGYPYTINDPYVSVNLVQRLESLGVRVHTAEMTTARQRAGQAHILPKNLFWHYSNIAIQAGLHYAQLPEIDGIIHLTAFGCGPDAMVGKLLELECKQIPKPFIAVTIDEHTGEAGLQTRLEAFVDMVRHKRRGLP